MPKLMLSLGSKQMEKLHQLAEEEDVTVQELLRVLIIPFFFKYRPLIEEQIKKEIVLSTRYGPR